MEKVRIKNWIVAILVAAVYLTVSFVFNSWSYSWMIWIGYAVYRATSKNSAE